MRIPKLLAVLALTACAPMPQAEVSMNRSTTTTAAPTAPVVNNFIPTRAAVATKRGNTAILADFLELEFKMESGRTLPVLTRFEGPITIALSGAIPGTAPSDLAQLIGRFRAEAGLNVSQTQGPASITVEFVPRSQIRAMFSNVSCFVAPRVGSWAEYKAAKGTGILDWSTLRQRERVAIFVPSDSSPQEVRDCLHEEIAQAMGPLNDLYYLSDSVFNDDNFNSTLTGFDMLMLRLHYAPDLRSGMTKEQVASLLPGLLKRYNPAGEGAGQVSSARTPQAWVQAMEGALGGGGTAGSRSNAAYQALAIAKAQNWSDGRLAFSYYAIGRIAVGKDSAAARAAFAEAGRIYRATTGAEIHAAHVDMQLAAIALSSGDAAQAIALADRAIPVVRQAQNASLLATLMMVKAQALELDGRTSEAKAMRLDSLAWARYGFGAESVVRKRMAEISALMPSQFKLALSNG